MALRDVMNPFTLYRPTSVDDVLSLMSRHEISHGPGQPGDAWVVAGQAESLDWFKDRIVKPEVVIDLSRVAELKGIRTTADGIEIGALTTLTEIEKHPDIRSQFRVLSEAAGKVATPQIRNRGTLGGNVVQDTRCWYYRGGLPCYRAGGDTCYADTPTSMNREHCIFEADRCVAVSPSDTAPALVALDAEMVIRDTQGNERIVPAEEFFIGPSVDITRMTVLGSGDLLTAVRIPNRWAGAHFYFEKAADREAWDFPLVNVASALKVQNGVIEDARVCVGAVAARPLRLHPVEETIVGEAISEEVAELAGLTAVWGARPLNHNHFKIDLMQNLVKRAVRDAFA